MIDLLDFGAQPNNTAFDNGPALRAALAAGSGLHCEIKLPPGYLTIGSRVDIPNRNIGLYGKGLWNTVFRRMAGYPSGDLFRIDGCYGGLVFENFRVENAYGFENPSGAAIKATNSQNVHLLGIECFDGWRGFEIAGVGGLRMDRTRYLQSAGYAASWQSDAGLLMSGHNSDCHIGASAFDGQNADAAKNLTAGVRIAGADGVIFSGISARGKYGVDFAGGADSIDDVYFATPIIDNCGIVGVRISGNVAAGKVFTNIRFFGAHVNVGNRVGAQDGIVIGGNADEVKFEGGNVNLAYGNGILLLGGNNYNGVPKRLIDVRGVDVSENNLSNIGNIHGIAVAGGASGINIEGCTVQNRTAAGHQKYGIGLGDGLSKCVVVHNRLFGNELGGLYAGTGHTNCLIQDNPGA